MKKINIIIHGFAGGLYEIKPLYKFLRSKNLTAYMVLLAGHGGARKDLSAYSYADWIDSASEQIKKIIKSYGAKTETEINLIGFSMGGLICANLTDFFNVKKIVFVNTPVYYWNIKQIAKNIIRDIKHKEYSHINHYIKSAANSPVKALLNFTKILRRTKRRFSSACVKRADPLILQCLDDDTVQIRSAGFIKNEIGASSKVIYYKTGGHLVFLSETSNQICSDIYDYLKQH